MYQVSSNDQEFYLRIYPSILLNMVCKIQECIAGSGTSSNDDMALVPPPLDTKVILYFELWMLLRFQSNFFNF